MRNYNRKIAPERSITDYRGLKDPNRPLLPKRSFKAEFNVKSAVTTYFKMSFAYSKCHLMKQSQLTRCSTQLIQVDPFTAICWTSPFVILGVSGLHVFCHCYSISFYGNSVSPDQTPHYMASDLGLQCLPMTL